MRKKRAGMATAWALAIAAFVGAVVGMDWSRETSEARRSGAETPQPFGHLFVTVSLFTFGADDGQWSSAERETWKGTQTDTQDTQTEDLWAIVPETNLRQGADAELAEHAEYELHGRLTAAERAWMPCCPVVVYLGR